MTRKKAKPKRAARKRVKRPAYDLFLEAGLIGCAKGLPKDLATNKRYFQAFGKDK
jgi:hypothetical protein